MTPLEFANQYLEMDAFIYPLEADGADAQQSTTDAAGDWQRLRVARYRLGASSWDKTLWQDISPHLHQPVSVKVKNIWGDTEDVTLTREQLWRHFHYPFVGKGSPEQAQIVIQLVYRYHRAVFTPAQFVAKDFIGLDCNGFVGNYIQRVVQGQDWSDADNNKDPGPTTLIGDLLRRQGSDNQVTAMESLAPDGIYLFGFCDPNGNIYDPSKQNPTAFGHVMITEPGTLDHLGEGLQVGVIEATAAGNAELRNLNYTILGATSAQSGTVFHILRGSPNATMNVRIARLNLF